MPFDLAETKRKARQTLHGLASVIVLYTGPEDGAQPVELRARWHNKKSVPVGDLDSQGFADILATVDKLVFNQSNLAAPEQSDGMVAAAVTLKRLGTVEFAAYGVTFYLEGSEPGDGPENVYWSVVRE